MRGRRRARKKKERRMKEAMETIRASAKPYHIIPSEKLPPGMSLEEVKKALSSPGTADKYLVKKEIPKITVRNSPAAA